MTSNDFDETSAQTILKKSINASFVDPETEKSYLNYSWEHFRKVYTLAGFILFLFTVYLIVSMAYFSMEPLSQIPLIIVIVASFLGQMTLISFWKKKAEPKYLNLVIALLSTLMSAIYLISIDPGTEQLHQQILRLCIINSLGMIFLSNGRIFLILLNICILVVPIIIILFLFYEHAFIWRMIPIYLGLSSFMVFLDNYSRRNTRLDWHRRQSLGKLNKEMIEITNNALDEKTRIEKAAEENVLLMEEVFLAKEEAEKQNQFLQDLIEGIPLGITVMDKKTNIVQINRQALELHGITDEKALFKNSKNLKALIDDLRSREGHHSPRFWKSYDKILPQKMSQKKGTSAPAIKSDFKLDNGVFLSFMEVAISNDYNILITQDITYRKEIEATMRKQALTDSLTGLANRHAFDLKFEDAIKRSHRNKTSLGLAMIDLDKFKPINDTYGHPVGDKILQYVGQALKEQVRSTDLPCRLGGDEFAVLFTDISPEQPPTNACNRILEALNKMIEIDELELNLGASIGLTFSNSPDIKPDQLIDEADRALYRAKDEGRGIMEIVQTDIC